MFYPLKVNWALVVMGVDPSQFYETWCSDMQQLGRAANLSPQETALIIVSYGFGPDYPPSAYDALGGWVVNQKLNTFKPEINEALQRMGITQHSVLGAAMKKAQQ